MSRLLTLFTISILTLLPAHAAPPQYTLTDLGIVGVRGMDVNTPTVVGVTGITFGAVPTAAILSPTLTSLGHLPGRSGSVATSVAAGQIVGSAFVDGPGGGLPQHAFLWTQAGGMIDLGSLAGPAGFSVATDVNSTGVVVGMGDNATQTGFVPYRWIGGVLSALPTPNPGGSGVATAINDVGDIVGNNLLWPVEGGIIDLHDPTHPKTIARAINNARQVAGVCYDFVGDCLFLWDPTTGMQRLPLLPGDTEGDVWALNDTGVVVGESRPPHPFSPDAQIRTAVLWEQGQPFALLPQVTNGGGWTLNTAVGITNQGHIAGMGRFNGQGRGFILTPIPTGTTEPPEDTTAQTPRDLNGDGTADLVWQHTSTGVVAVWYLNQAGIADSAFIAQVHDPAWELISTGDLDGDGHPDLVWRHTSGLVAVWFMQGAQFITAALLATPSDWTLSAVGDLNNDRTADLLWRHQSTGQVAVWLMQGGQVLAGVFLDTIPDLQWQLVAAQDINGDEQTDLVWQHAGTGQVGAWFMQGLVRTGTQSLAYIGDPAWQATVVGDVDGDGQADLVWRHRVTGTVVTWFLQEGRFVGAGVIGQADNGWQLH